MKENNQQDQSNPAWVCLGSLYRLAIVDPLPEKSYEGSPQPPDMILRISNGYLEIMLTYNTVLVFWCILVILGPLIRLPTPTIAILWSIILAFPVGGCSRNTRIETELCIRHSHRTIRLPWRLCLNSNTFQSRNFWKPKKGDVNWNDCDFDCSISWGGCCLIPIRGQNLAATGLAACPWGKWVWTHFVSVRINASSFPSSQKKQNRQGGPAPTLETVSQVFYHLYY